MKTKVINLYSFDELSEEAKEKAIEEYRYSDRDYFWMEDNIQSVIKALEHFGFDVLDYSVDYSSAARSSFKLSNKNYFNEEGLKGARLWKWLNNQKESIIPIYEKKYANVYESSCPFTGYFMDEVFLDVFRKFLAKPSENITLDYLIDQAVEACLRATQEDYEHQNSDEFISEELENMGEVFDKEGSLI